MDGTRNAVYRNVPGVKVILDNEWAAMTGGQPTPTTRNGLDANSNHFDLPGSLKAHGANVVISHAYDRKALRKDLTDALIRAENGVYTTIVVQDGPCIQKVPASRQRVYVEPEVCKKCGLCLICPGIESGADNVPYYNNLCAGCGGKTPSCVQMCPTGVLKHIQLPEPSKVENKPAKTTPIQTQAFRLESDNLPNRLSLAIRGVGGQGNLFFGRVLTQLAMLAGYDSKNIIKGETHGMSQMGGPVISTFGCGDVVSPITLPQMADCLIVLEKGEVLRQDFLGLLRPGGVILMASTRIIPFGSSEANYPGDDAIMDACKGYQLVQVDVLKTAIELGDKSGRMSNIVMMGILSKTQPFNIFPAELWLEALRLVNSREDIFSANRKAFLAGREIDPGRQGFRIRPMDDKLIG
jgi:indolepyruvate ferredoxin oxidoreductase alpha subunit